MDIMPRLSYEELENRLETQETLVECIQALQSKSNDLGVSVYNVLSIVAGFYEADRVRIYEFIDKGEKLRCTYKFSVTESIIDPNEDDSDTIIKEDWLNTLEEKGEIFVEVKTSDLPKEIKNKIFKNQEHLDNFMSVPLIIEGKLCGFISVGNLMRNKNSPLLLQSVAGFILNDIKSNDSFEQKIFQAIASSTLAMYLVNIIDNNFHVSKDNPKISKFVCGNDSFNFDDANKQIREVMGHIASADFINGILKFVDLNSVETRLSEKNIISHEFYGEMFGWCRANFMPVSKDMDGRLKYVIFSIQPIEEEKRRELEYQQILRNTLGSQNEIYTEMLQAQSAGIFSFKRINHEILMMNPAALNLFGWDSIVNAQDNIMAVLGKMESPKKDAIIHKILALKNGDPEYTYEFSIHKMSGEFKWVLGHSKVVKLSNHEEIIINSFTDITANKKMETELFYLSQTDALTKINNRGSGERRIELLLKKGDCGMFCLFDVDKFKSINDNFGHSVGDEVLVEIAKAMKKAFRGNDIIMRLGGDEFAIFAVGVMDEKIGSMCIERFFQTIGQISIKPMRDRKVSVSLGAVFTVTEGETFDHLYQRADELLYECKKLPGCQYSFAHGK
ncbi:MAG: diguanylate cyclase [Treponema sp.]|nr:diguanylate cyclase [Treponema sp.]